MIRATFPWLLALSVAHAADNVLLIIADDFGADQQSLYNPTNGATAPTPNINSLAASGVRFTQAYACPVCSPTRAAMLTGRHGFRTGAGGVVSVAAGNSLSASETTLPEAIARHPSLGIQSACFGKWHLTAGGPLVTANAPNTIGGWPHYAGCTAGTLTSYTSWTKTVNGTSSNSTTYATTDVVNDAVAWIQSRRALNQPWLAWVAFNAPHTPFHNPPSSLHGYGTNPATNTLKYRAAVEAMDTEIGRLLLAVDASTTHVIFVGDNGSPAQVIQAPYDAAHAKDTLYEGGTRVPLIIRGPAVAAAGRTHEEKVHVVDLFSTMLELAGVPLPTDSTLDSRSLLPALSQVGESARKWLYNEEFDRSTPTTGGRSLRDERYKLIRLNNGTDEFYDLAADPAETTNLIAAGSSAMSSTHQAFYHRLRYRLGAFTNVTSNSPSSHTHGPSGFTVTVTEDTAASQTLWWSDDLDFWKPVGNAIRSSHSGNLSLTAPPPLPAKAFFSVLAESP